jgi:hypothetical protein
MIRLPPENRDFRYVGVKISDTFLFCHLKGNIQWAISSPYATTICHKPLQPICSCQYQHYTSASSCFDALCINFVATLFPVLYTPRVTAVSAELTHSTADHCSFMSTLFGPRWLKWSGYSLALWIRSRWTSKLTSYGIDDQGLLFGMSRTFCHLHHAKTSVSASQLPFQQVPGGSFPRGKAAGI